MPVLHLGPHRDKTVWIATYLVVTMQVSNMICVTHSPLANTKLTLANTFYKKQSYSKATYHSTKQCMQLDFAIMGRAPCSDTAEMQKRQDRPTRLATTKQ